MSFEVQNPLEQSLINATKDPAYRPQFYKDLVRSDIFIIQDGAAVPEKEGAVTFSEDTQIQIANVQFNGKNYIPIFSSLPRLQVVLKGEAAYLRVNALEFLRMTKGADLVLNPGSDYGKEITAAEAGSIVDGSIWKPVESYTAKTATQVLLGQPKNYPTELAEALSRLFKKRRGVKKAWLAHFFNPDRDERPHTLVALEVTRDYESIVAEAGIVVQNVHIPDPPVDFMEITGKGSLDGYFTHDTRPFYERRFFGLF